MLMSDGEERRLDLVKPLSDDDESVKEVSPGSGGNGTESRFAELRAMADSYGSFAVLDRESMQRAYQWLGEVFELTVSAPALPPVTPAALGAGTEEVPSPRIFISQKKPETNMERIACLAYYLTNHRGMQHFKTSDVVALNTEAASAKFTRPSRDVDNAERRGGYVVAAGNGVKQLTTRGEALVRALPNREAVQQALREHPHRTKGARTGVKRISGAQVREES
uniref:Uncharacterized protein n=1 Tax=Streptoalloteichus sp. ATCC 53650 TaxID=756733 RepID=K4NYP3_9PSEU|nr:hypothetical protein [Streptoalloteichus sp. ATCC 53650]